MREERVVVFAEKAHRRRRAGIGPRRLGQVEALAALRVAEGDEPGLEPLERLGEPREIAQAIPFLASGMSQL